MVDEFRGLFTELGFVGDREGRERRLRMSGGRGGASVIVVYTLMFVSIF